MHLCIVCVQWGRFAFEKCWCCCFCCCWWCYCRTRSMMINSCGGGDDRTQKQLFSCWQRWFAPCARQCACMCVVCVSSGKQRKLHRCKYTQNRIGRCSPSALCVLQHLNEQILFVYAEMGEHPSRWASKRAFNAIIKHFIHMRLFQLNVSSKSNGRTTIKSSDEPKCVPTNASNAS